MTRCKKMQSDRRKTLQQETKPNLEHKKSTSRERVHAVTNESYTTRKELAGYEYYKRKQEKQQCTN